MIVDLVYVLLDVKTVTGEQIAKVHVEKVALVPKINVLKETENANAMIHGGEMMLLVPNPVQINAKIRYVIIKLVIVIRVVLLVNLVLRVIKIAHKFVVI